MKNARLPPIILAALALTLAPHRSDRAVAETPVEPPAVGRPSNFSGAVGAYRISYRVTPTEVVVEDPVTLIVRISGSGPKGQQPERANLRLLPKEIEEDFYVQAAPEQDRHLPAESAWEFAWRLRPKHTGAVRVPRFQFVYYDPTRRQYAPRSTRETIVLKVSPRPLAATPGQQPRTLQAPDRFFEIATGGAVLARGGDGLSPVWLVVLLVGPPLLCGAWYVVWRVRHPAAAGTRRRLASRVAREALAALLAPGLDNPPAQTADAVAVYLHQRLGLRAAEPTPAEVIAHLRRAGLSSTLADRVAGLFRTCDAARFAPTHAAAPALPAEAAAVIRALEVELCSPRG
ncbi:MAG: BatD family protein [Gemmataceae bacterium]|nr:BatD family protein [Gemmataceae bacterium]